MERIATATYSLLPLELKKDTVYPFALGDQFEGEFSFGDKAPSVGQMAQKLPIKEVIFSFGQSTGLALLRVGSHDPERHPPMAIESAPEDLQSWLGRYAFVVGFPSRDARMPPPFVEALLDPELPTEIRDILLAGSRRDRTP